jgi:2-polyprenyl-3-methyl-5-hydroxy-6-metoxy-1,4-benzoquinol methylase
VAVTREQILWCYRVILGREPESEAAIGSHLGCRDMSALRLNFLSSPEFAELEQVRLASADSFAPSAHELAELRSLYAQVDAYQPVYKLEHQFSNKSVSRDCVDRCKLLQEDLGVDLPNLRILDVGCSMGYLTLFLADKGASTLGIDAHAPNVAFCRSLARALGVDARFEVDVFNEAFTQKLQEGEHDVVLLFSVLHHVVAKYGLASVQKMMSRVLDSSDVIYVELARKSEDVPFAWRDSLPADELDIFAGIPDLRITKLAELPALGGTVARPLYKVVKVAESYCGHEHRPLSIERSAIRDGSTRNRKYASSPTLFTKLFNIEQEDSYRRFLSERDIAQRVVAHANFPTLLASEQRGKLGVLTYKKLSGKTLMSALYEGEKIDSGRIAVNLANILTFLSDINVFWNDLRSHNLVLTEDQAVAVDFEVAGRHEIEHTLNIFLWLLYDLHSGSLQTQKRQIFASGPMNVGRPPVSPEKLKGCVSEVASVAWKCENIKHFALEWRVRRKEKA